MNRYQALETQATEAGRQLGVTLYARSAAYPLLPSHLTAAEHRQYEALQFARRRREWLCGRAALKPLLGALGLGDDTAAHPPPHPRWSLSHTRGLALALGCCDPAMGLGVDLELGRRPDPGAARLFLTDGERARLSHSVEVCARQHLLRLWCLKEAAFKATPGNRMLALHDFEVTEPYASPVRIRCTRRVGITFTATYVHVTAASRTGGLAVAIATSTGER